MVFRLGVIPAAGNASRFNGVWKELLPARDGRTLLWHAVNRVPFEQVVIVTREDKIAMHAREIGHRAVYAIQREKFDLWGALLMSLEFDADRYTMTMPDTLFREDALVDWPCADFALGTFETDTPERFGVLVDGKWVIDKDVSQPVPATAWGAVCWTRSVASLWREAKPQTYTQAINLAISKFGLETFPIGEYHDMASIADYLEYMHQ